MIPYPGILSDALGTAGPATPPGLMDLAPPAYARKPSIVDRVAARLFPTAPYSGLLEPGSEPGLGRQALVSFGTNLLRAGAPSENQLGFLGNLGAAYQGVDFPKMAEQALQLQAYRKQTQALANAAAAHPPKPGETPEDTYGRIAGMVSDLAGQPGTEELIGKLSNVLNALRPGAAVRPRYVYKTLHENGHDFIYRVNEDDPNDKIRIGMASPSAGMPVLAYDAEGNAVLVNRGTATAQPVAGVAKPLTPLERTAASRVESATNSVDNIERIGRANPQALNEAIAALRLSHYGKVGQAAADIRNAFSSPEGQELYGEMSNVLLTVAPTYGGARPTDILLNLEQATSTPGVAGSKTAFDTALRHMRERLHDLRAQARIPEPPAAAPAPTLKPTPTPPAYNPKFWHPK